MSDAIKKLVGTALAELVESARSGGPKVRVGLMAAGSEHGPEEIARGARLAMQNYHNVKPVLIGPRLPGYEDLDMMVLWIGDGWESLTRVKNSRSCVWEISRE